MKPTLPSYTAPVLIIMGILFNITTYYFLNIFATEVGMGAFAVGIMELPLLLVKWIIAAFVVTFMLPPNQSRQVAGRFTWRYLGFTLLLMAMAIGLGIFARGVLSVWIPMLAQLVGPYLCLTQVFKHHAPHDLHDTEPQLA